VVSAIDVMLSIRAGQFGQAEKLAAACARSGAAAGDADHEWWSAAQLVTIRWYQGRRTELLPMLHDRVHSPVQQLARHDERRGDRAAAVDPAGPGAGLWHRIPVGQENLRVHRRFFKDIETADTAVAPV
jgi:hypothetical protein